jgi:hypothetical protein
VVEDMPRQGPAGRTKVETPGGREIVTPSDLITQHVSLDATRPVARTRRILQLRGIPVATVGPDPAAVTPMCAVSARDMPVVDTLAAVAAQDPTGVLLIETRDAAFAFEVKHGRIIGARGTGPRGQLEAWVAEVHRRHPERFAALGSTAPDAPAWIDVARAFVEEHVLDQLALCREPGARLTLARGDIEWCGTRIPEHVGPTLRHLLLEHARRYDETPRIMAGLGSLDRVAVPMREPGQRPTAAPRKRNADENDWDFFDDPDPAALAEWDDAVRVWSLCDGASTLAEVVDEALLGHFRGILALHTLVKAQHIVLVDSGEAPMSSGERPLAAVIPMSRGVELRDDDEVEAAAASVDPATSSAQRPVVALSQDDVIASDPDWEENSTSYSFVLRTPKTRKRTTGRAKPATPPPPPPKWSPRREPKMVLDPIDAAMAEVLEDVAEATRRESIVEIAAADTRREAIVEMDGPAETRREMIVDPVTAPIDVETGAESTMARASASRTVGEALDRALPSPKIVTIALALTGVVATAAAVIAIAM